MGLAIKAMPFSLRICLSKADTFFLPTEPQADRSPAIIKIERALRIGNAMLESGLRPLANAFCDFCLILLVVPSAESLVNHLNRAGAVQNKGGRHRFDIHLLNQL